MKTLARELKCGIDIICMGYYYHKETNVILKARELANRIQRFCGSFLQGNIYGMQEEEYQSLQKYVLEVLEDYLEAIEQRDLVFMLDTLYYGLRELVNIYIEAEDGRNVSCDVLQEPFDSQQAVQVSGSLEEKKIVEEGSIGNG